MAWRPRFVGRAGIDGATDDASLFRATARRSDARTESVVLNLAAHLEDQDRARSAYQLSLSEARPSAAAELDDLHDLVQEVLAHHQALDPLARGVIERRRAGAARLVTDQGAAARVITAPTAYLLARDSEDLARHCELLEPRPSPGEARVAVTPTEQVGVWNVDIASRDRRGLLAAFTGVLAGASLDVLQADIATWDDGAALQAFTVRAKRPPDPVQLQAVCEASLAQPPSSPPLPDVVVTFDDDASPWHTVCDIRAADRPGLLHALAVAIATCEADVHLARVSTVDAMAVDRFDLTDSAGRRLDATRKAALVAAVASGVIPPARRRLPWSRRRGARYDSARSSGESTSLAQSGFVSTTSTTRS